MKKTKFKVARYEDRDAAGNPVWRGTVSGDLYRGDEKVQCSWLPDSGPAKFALVDQWGFAHQWS